MLERTPHRHAAFVAVLVVARAPRVPADGEHDGHVVHERGGGHRGGVVAVLAERGEVDERLEGRAGLPARQRRAVVLALRVVAPADERADLAGGRIECHQRGLQAAGRIVAPQAREARLQPIEAAHDRRLGKALEDEIERAVHAGGIAALAEALLELGAHVVGEVRRRLSAGRRRGHAHGLGLRGLPVRWRERAQLAHACQHDVAARARPLGVHRRRVAVGPAYHAGQQRGLGRRHLVDLLMEVRARGGPDAADRAAAALAQVDLVQIGLEDLGLGVPPLHQRGQPRLARLAEERAARADQPILHELLGDGGAALHDAPRAQVGPRRPQQAARVHPAVLEEAMVLGGEDRVDEDQGHLGQPHGTVVFAGAVVGAGQHFRLEGGGADVVAIACDARDALVARLEPDALRGRPRCAAQVDLPGAADAAELAGRGHRPARVGVFQPRQRAGQVHAPHVHAGNQGLGAGVDERGAALFDPLEARQGQRGVDGDGGDEDGKESEGGDPQQPQAAAGKPPPQGTPVRSPPPGREGPRHARLCPPQRACRDVKAFSMLVGMVLPGLRVPGG